MAKYHIGKSGQPTICRAKNGNCPFGTEKQHYDTKQQADNAIATKLQKDTNVLSSAKKNETNTLSTEKYNDIIETMSQKADELDIYKPETVETYENMLYDTAKEIKDVDNNINDLLNIVNDAMSHIDKKKNPNLSESIDNFVSNVKNGGKYSYQEIDNLENIEISDDYMGKIYDVNAHDIADTQSASLIHKIQATDGQFISHKKVSDNLYYAKIETYGQQFSYLYYNEDGLDNPQNMKTVEIHNFNNSDISPIPKNNLFDGVDKDSKEAMLSRDVLSKIAWGNDASIRSIRDELMSDVSRNNSKSRVRRAVLEIQMSGKIMNNKTYLHQYHDFNMKKPKDEKTYIKMFKSGISTLKERDTETAKSIKSTKEFKDLKRTIIKEGRDGMMQKYGVIDNEEDIETTRKSLETVLTTEDKDRLREYTSSSYKHYGSRAMGGDRVILAKENDGGHVNDDKLHNLNSSLKKMQEINTEKRNLYRGFVAPQGMTAEQYVKSFKSGDTVTNTKLLSTSTSFSTAMNFTKAYNENILFIYQTKKGAQVESFSDNSYERESILPIGEKMVVVDTAIDAGGRGVVFFTDKE